jgi:hypothetical protein
METLRAGQLAFNELHRTDPDIANKIRGTMDDPFYDDTRLARFETKVAALRAASARGSEAKG